MMLRPIVLCAVLAAALCAIAQAHAQFVGSQRINIEVERMAGGSEKIIGHAYAPQRVPAGAKLPAVVVVHGPAGPQEATEGFWGRELAASGMVVLVLDSFLPRGVQNTIEDQSRVSTAQMVRDAFGALDYLATQPFVDPQRVALMGMSKGGAVALLAADRRAQGSARTFAAHVPLYPSCAVQYRNPQVSVPILMLIGERDDYTGVKSCSAYAERIRAAGGKVELKIYKGAHHGFDGDTGEPGEIRLAKAQNYRDCVLYNEDDGTTVYAGTGAVLDTPKKVLEVLQRHCMRRGATVSANAEAKQQALQDVKAFLRIALKP